MSDGVFYRVAFSGGSRGSEPKRNGVKGPPDRRMENGVSGSCLLLRHFKNSSIYFCYILVDTVQQR